MFPVDRISYRQPAKRQKGRTKIPILIYALKKSSSRRDASDINTLAYLCLGTVAFNEPSILEKLASGKMTSTCWNPCQLIFVADTSKERDTPHSMHIRMPQDSREGRPLCWRLFGINKHRQLGDCGVTLLALRRVILQVKHRVVCSPGWCYEETG